MFSFLTSVIGIATVIFYLYMVVGFYMKKTMPEWGVGKKLAFAFTWPATVWHDPLKLDRELEKFLKDQD